MGAAPGDDFELERGERGVAAWPVEPAVGPDGSDRPGQLVLTTRRLSFFRRRGLLGGGRLEKPPQVSWRLEKIREVTGRRYELKIGYGDRIEIPGLAVDGRGFRLNRETPSAPVVETIETARRARRSELGLPLL